MIDTYIDEAKRHSDLPSDRQLAKIMGVNPSTLAQYRSGRALPTDATMLHLSDLAGIPHDQALLDLALMRSNSEPARKVLLNLKKKLVTTACAVGLLTALTLTPSPASASPANAMNLQSFTVYYGK